MKKSILLLICNLLSLFGKYGLAVCIYSLVFILLFCLLISDVNMT